MIRRLQFIELTLNKGVTTISPLLSTVVTVIRTGYGWQASKTIGYRSRLYSLIFSPLVLTHSRKVLGVRAFRPLESSFPELCHLEHLIYIFK